MADHNHIVKLMRMIETGQLPVEPGSAQAIDVAHDEWCGIFDNRRCNCAPDIQLRWSTPAASRN